MKQLLEVLKRSTEYLEQRGIENPRRQAEDIVCDALGLQRIQLYLEHDRPLTDPELNECRSKLLRRGKGEPAQYIHGRVEFYNCQIKVTSAVLIPRQETEILVDKITHELSSKNLNGKTLWDVCCGSGCIGIALKKKFPELNVFLTDTSSAALKVAKENAELNSVEVTFKEGDLLEPFRGTKANYVVCNPPYISEKEFEELDKSVKDFEPHLALVSGKTGLEFYERLAKDLPNYLFPQSKVWFEIGKDQGEQIKNLFDTPFWRRSRVESDWSGHNRFFFLENE